MNCYFNITMHTLNKSFHTTSSKTSNVTSDAYAFYSVFSHEGCGASLEGSSKL